MSNLIIVEGENDKYFLESFIEYLNLQNIEISSPICKIDDFYCLEGMNNLKIKLKDIKFDKYDKIGIILDADTKGVQGRIDFINESLKVVCSDIQLKNVNQIERSNELDVDIACYIINIDGKGELETLLKNITSQPSTYADCLNVWKNCLKEEGKSLNQKDFDKLWVSFYLKFDTCKGKYKKQKSKKCANEIIQNEDCSKNNLKTNQYTLQKNIWNFDHSLLNELKEFLLLFVNE